jgi:hypothetical protein
MALPCHHTVDFAGFCGSAWRRPAGLALPGSHSPAYGSHQSRLSSWKRRNPLRFGNRIKPLAPYAKLPYITDTVSALGRTKQGQKGQRQMTDFWTALQNHADKANATTDGELFTNSNFSFDHTGGGCTCYGRTVNDTAWYVIITDSSGTEAVINPDLPDDFYLVGMQHPDLGYINGIPAKTATEALAIAESLHDAAANNDFTHFTIEG